MGFDSKTFETSLQRIHEFHYLMGSSMAKDALKPWTPNAFEDQPELKFKTKYFSIKRDARNCTNVPFHPLVDPYGILKKQLADAVRHGIENEVIYKELVIDDEDSTRM